MCVCLGVGEEKAGSVGGTAVLIECSITQPGHESWVWLRSSSSVRCEHNSSETGGREEELLLTPGQNSPIPHCVSTPGCHCCRLCFGRIAPGCWNGF